MPRGKQQVQKAGELRTVTGQLEQLQKGKVLLAQEHVAIKNMVEKAVAGRAAAARQGGHGTWATSRRRS